MKVCGWLKKFCGELTCKVPSEEVVISKKQGQLLHLPEEKLDEVKWKGELYELDELDEFDEKLWISLIAQKRAGRNINCHTVYGVLMGLIKSNLHLYGGYLEFTATDGRLYSL